MSSDDTTPNGSDSTETVLRRVMSIDSNRFDLVFALVLLAYIGTLIVMSFEVRPEARLVPLVAAIPTFVLLCLIVIMLISERAADLAAEFSETHLFGVQEQELPQGEQAEESSSDVALEQELLARRKRIAISFIVVLSLLTLVYVVGFLLAIPLFLITFYRLRAKQSWPITLGTTVFVWAFVIVVFYVLLDVRLWQGILGLEVASYFPF